MAIIHSVYTDMFILYIPVYLQLANTLFALATLIFLLFKELGLGKKIAVFSASIVFSIIMDAIISVIAINMDITDLDSLRREHLPDLVSILYPQLLLIAIASWFVRRKMSDYPLKQIAVNIKENRSLVKVLTLILIQFVILGSMFSIQYGVDSDKSLILTVLIYLTFAVSLAGVVFMLRMLTIARADAVRTTQAIYVDDIHNMFTSVRGQRHDFLNHVQVIHTMAQMGKLDQLQAYTATLVQETREVSDIINHASPALAAFAQAKTTVALGLGISFTCELPIAWNVQESSIAMIDLIKILGNLVDNAFDETMRLPTELRTVCVTIQTVNNIIALEVANSGHPLDPEVKSRMFQHGFSTKGEGHSGLGLAIVQDRVHHYKGNLDIRSDADTQTTTFKIELPYREQAAS
ncbi:sensor histidine kinase [Cohnella yongneupensis]|uniref:histidine kinase n=1 Tax=Cohnella yongneupensis TaxID=425006 RepID=A0ABW0R309_9BACL